MHNKKLFISVIWLFSPSVEFGIMKVLGLAKRAESALTPRGARHGYVAQLAGLDITDDTSELQLSVIFAVGCDVLGTPLLSELHYLHRRGGHWPPTQREDIT